MCHDITKVIRMGRFTNLVGKICNVRFYMPIEFSPFRMGPYNRGYRRLSVLLKRISPERETVTMIANLGTVYPSIVFDVPEHNIEDINLVPYPDQYLDVLNEDEALEVECFMVHEE